jgi:hypothetical protein
VKPVLTLEKASNALKSKIGLPNPFRPRPFSAFKPVFLNSDLPQLHPNSNPQPNLLGSSGSSNMGGRDEPVVMMY